MKGYFFMGALMARSFDRTVRVYCAMKCRGFDGSYNSGPVRSIIKILYTIKIIGN